MAEDQPPVGSTTTALPVPSPVEIAIAKLSETIDRRLDSQDTKLDKLVDGGIETNVRLDRVETRLTGAEARVDILEGRAVNTSLRVQGASQGALEGAAALAAEKLAREALAEKVDGLTKSQDLQLAILGRLDKFAANPNVKIILAIAATALASWAASKGLK